MYYNKRFRESTENACKVNAITNRESLAQLSAPLIKYIENNVICYLHACIEWAQKTFTWHIYYIINMGSRQRKGTSVQVFKLCHALTETYVLYKFFLTHSKLVCLS